MPHSLPVGFMDASTLTTPSKPQLLLEFLLVDRLQFARKNMRTPTFLLKNTLSPEHKSQLDSGFYGDTLGAIISVSAKKNPHLPDLKRTRDWLRSYATLHAPLCFELGIIELLCFLTISFPDKSITTTHNHQMIIDFYWSTVANHFTIASNLTQLTRERFLCHYDHFEHRFHQRYHRYARKILKSYHFDLDQLGYASPHQQLQYQKNWQLILQNIIENPLGKLPVEWIKGSVNRRWTDLSFFKFPDADLHDECTLHHILTGHLAKLQASIETLQQDLGDDSIRSSNDLASGLAFGQ